MDKKYRKMFGASKDDVISEVSEDMEKDMNSQMLEDIEKDMDEEIKEAANMTMRDEDSQLLSDILDGPPIILEDDKSVKMVEKPVAIKVAVSSKLDNHPVQMKKHNDIVQQKAIGARKYFSSK